MWQTVTSPARIQFLQSGFIEVYPGIIIITSTGEQIIGDVIRK